MYILGGISTKSNKNGILKVKIQQQKYIFESFSSQFSALQEKRSKAFEYIKVLQ